MPDNKDQLVYILTDIHEELPEINVRVIVKTNYSELYKASMSMSPSTWHFERNQKLKWKDEKITHWLKPALLSTLIEGRVKELEQDIHPKNLK